MGGRGARGEAGAQGPPPGPAFQGGLLSRPGPEPTSSTWNRTLRAVCGASCPFSLFLGVKSNRDAEAAVRPPLLWLGTGLRERGSALLLRRCFSSKLRLAAVDAEPRFSR